MSNRSYSQMMDTIREHQKKLPIDVYAIADAFEIKVCQEKRWPNELSGKIVRDSRCNNESGYIIYINGNHPETRQRFTLAHEIAHFILHQEHIGDGIADDGLYRSGLSSEQEAMANKLAADILMPWDLVGQKIRQGINSVEKMAKEFNVSPSAMAIRLGVPS